jgi:hypothetical protein
MLHLQPRLRAAQDRRSAVGVTGPDLTQITNFAAILPEPLLDHNGRSIFYMRQLRMADRNGPDLDPFYVEQLLAKLDAQRGGSDRRSAVLTAAERRAGGLLRLAEPVLQSIEYAAEGYGFRAEAAGISSQALRRGNSGSEVRRATRADLFYAALEHADHVARLLETHLIDPIRADSLAPDDPFVQTTLYVLAPLYEPLAAAMIWPVTAQLMQRLGRRNISQVVAILATGSHATDVSRAVENGTTYAALSELEILTGLRGDAAGRAELTTLVTGSNPALAAQTGEKLFDNIYLLDREKSNQGLAHDSHEIAVLAGNALEALIVANGGLFLQEQLGIGLHGIDYYTGEQHPYSLLGAASDYVPLTETLRAVNRQEGRRLAHQWALRATQHENAAHHSLATALTRAAETRLTVSEMGLSEEKALAMLVQRLPELYATATPANVSELQVRREFVLPPSVAAELRQLPAAEWDDAFRDHVADVEQVFELAAGPQAVNEVWGGERVAPHADRPEREQHGLLEHVEQRMQRRLLDLLAISPAGLPKARRQIAAWLREIDNRQEEHRILAQSLSTATTQELLRAREELDRRNWQARYAQAVARIPTWWHVLVGAAAATALVALFAWLYLELVQRSWQPLTDGAMLLGLAVVIYLAGGSFYRWRVTAVQNLRHERVALAQAALTKRLQASANKGLVRLHEELEERLQQLSHMLAEAEDELSRWSEEEDEFATARLYAGEFPLDKIIPPDYITYLRQPKMSRQLWEQSCDFLRQRQDAHSEQNAERLAGLWNTPEWRRELKRLLAGAPADETATVPGQPQARTLADLIRRTVRQTMMPVDIEADSPARTELVRALAQEFSLEHLLWRSRSQAREMSRYLQGMNIDAQQLGLPDADLQDSVLEQLTGAGAAYSEVRSKHQYIENAWNRAKPTANYDVVDRLAARGTTVDFAAVSGDPDSDLTRALLEEFGVTLLPTGDPFATTFVRTVHGLGLRDFESIQRYRTELRYLSTEERAMVLFTTDDDDIIYRYRDLDSASFVELFEPESD